ncbi:MAG: DUF4345 family protein [Pseudomonadota bacterium]|nr:DUF4345 family protein [Pseudomonadota bacterium]MEC8633316.1 DUF4345 family protein [Pseudomonadota bacterium]
MFGQLLLGVTGAIFFGLGVVSVYDPEIPAGWSGIFIASQDAYAEIAAMYGGLEIAIGSILLASALIREYLKAGLWLLFVIISYIGIARAVTVLRELDSKFEVAGSQVDIEMTSSFTSYTWGALGFEFIISILALIALLNRPR